MRAATDPTHRDSDRSSLFGRRSAPALANTTIALLLTRPGPGEISSLDRQWSTLLTEVATEFGVPIEPVFRANDESIVLVEPELETAS